jgi:hypothetical protein
MNLKSELFLIKKNEGSSINCMGIGKGFLYISWQLQSNVFIYPATSSYQLRFGTLFLAGM